MTDVNKAIKPVESIILAPTNAGTIYKTNNFIQFHIGASNLNMWLTNNSYLTFDIKYSGVDVGAGHGYPNAAVTTACPTYIKNACNLFSSIEVLYGGDTIYSQPYNIEQNTLRQLYYGESYLQREYATYTTREMVAKDQYELGSNSLDSGIHAYLKFSNNTQANYKLKDTTIRNVMIPINQLLPFFMDCGSEGFPVRCLKNQLEIRLYISEPYRYLVDWNPTTKDFDYRLWKGVAKANENKMDHNQFMKCPLKTRYTNDSIQIENPRMFLQHYLPDAGLAARIDNEALNSADGMNWKFKRTEIAMRQVKAINTTNNLPFTNSTNNTQSLMLFAHRTGYSPGLMYRPNINSLYISFGSNQLPFQPIPGKSYSAPFEYKFTTDDVLNNIDTYFSETNNDYNYSYKFITDPDNAPNSVYTKVPTSSFLLMGANYVSDPTALGSQSSQWNSQYQAHFNAPYVDNIPETSSITAAADAGDPDVVADDTANTGLTFILGVESQWGLTLQNGKLTTLNI